MWPLPTEPSAGHLLHIGATQTAILLERQVFTIWPPRGEDWERTLERCHNNASAIFLFNNNDVKIDIPLQRQPRNHDKYLVLSSRTDAHRHFFFLNVVREWNKIGTAAVNISSVNQFKSCSKPPSCYAPTVNSAKTRSNKALSSLNRKSKSGYSS